MSSFRRLRAGRASGTRLAQLFAGPFVACLSCALSLGCLVTDSRDFPSEESYPPSVRSQPGAKYPLGRIWVLDLTDEAQLDIPLDVIISDLNVDQDLQALVFVDTIESARGGKEAIRPTHDLSVERVETIEFDVSALRVEGCHRVELQVSSQFCTLIPVPVREGDLGSAVWWFFTREDPTRTFDPVQCPVRPEPPPRTGPGCPELTPPPS
jgi:hypothetical protein